jgi:hypothetical protein
MGKIELLEKQIRELSSEELAELRQWFAEFDAELWDRQMEADVKAGRLDRLAEEALQEFAAGRTKPL